MGAAGRECKFIAVGPMAADGVCFCTFGVGAISREGAVDNGWVFADGWKDCGS
jgi:hypothetical protein